MITFLENIWQSQHIFQTSTYTVGSWTYPNPKKKNQKTSDSAQNHAVKTTIKK